jgi:hypothetical protein
VPHVCVGVAGALHGLNKMGRSPFRCFPFRAAKSKNEGTLQQLGSKPPSNQLYFKPPDKAVILSEALRRSIANRGLYGAESKDPGDAYWQMLLGAFRPQTSTEDKKVTNPERSASQFYRKP